MPHITEFFSLCHEFCQLYHKTVLTSAISHKFGGPRTILTSDQLVTYLRVPVITLSFDNLLG